MNVFATKLGKYYYILDENNNFKQLSSFNYLEYEKIKKKYFHYYYDHITGIRALYYFIFGQYNEEELFEKYDLNNDIIKKIRIIQRFFNNNIEDFQNIPELILEEFAPIYLQFIKNLYDDYDRFFINIDLNALKIFDRSKIALRRLSYNNPFLILKKGYKKYKQNIYNIGNFSFLKVNYSNELASNGLITSYDRSLSNIAKDDELRNMVVSRFGPKNGKILSIDYNAFQPRIIFSLSNYDTSFIGDFYYSLIKDIPIKIERNAFKIEIFRAIYGGLKNDSLINKLYPNIQLFENKIKLDYKSQNFVKTITGRRRYFLDNDYSDTKLLNSYIQMMHSDIVCEMIVKLDEFLLNKRSKFIGLISDNFIIDIHNLEYDEIINFCINNLQHSRYLSKCFLKLNFSEGKSWAEISPIAI